MHHYIHPHHHHKKAVRYKHFTLRRDLSLFYAVMCGVGIILGAGIYVLIGEGTALAGNAVWLSFIISSFLAVSTGLSYAELSSKMPKDSGEYIYAEHAFNRRIAFVVGYLIVTSMIISAAAIALGFASYFSALFSADYKILAAIAIIFVVSLINFYGIRQTIWVNVILTLLEVSGLLLVISLLPSHFADINYLEMASGMKGVLSAASLVFFAFIGFGSIVHLSEETKNPEKVIPRAIIISVAITTVLYVLVALSAVSVLGWQRLAVSEAPLADVVAVILGSKAFVVLSVIALLSTSNALLIALVTGSRMVYGIGTDIRKLGFLSRICPLTRTPWVAIALTAPLSMAFVFIKNIALVANMTNFTVFATFIAVNSAVIALRYKEKQSKYAFRMPLNIGRFPVLALFGIIFSIFMMISLDIKIIVVGILFVMVGFMLYRIVEE